MRGFLQGQHEFRASTQNQSPTIAATLQESDQSLVRRVMVKDDVEWVDRRRDKSQEPLTRKSNRISPSKPQPRKIETEDPPTQRSEKITGFLQKWLDDET
jgi:hypothetical protein